MNGLAPTPSNRATARDGLPIDGVNGFREKAARTAKGESSPQTRVRLSAAVEEAERRFERGELEAAERLCANLLAIDGRNAKVLQVLGMIAYRRGEYGPATKYMRRALAIDRKNALYHSNLGGALQAQSRSSEAAIRYRSALSLQPEMGEAHYNLGNALRDQGRLDEAISCYRQAIALRPRLAEAHNNLADVLRARGETVEAIEGYGRAIACRPMLSEAHTNLGAMLQQANLLDAALTCHRKAVALTPERAEAHYNLGSVLFAMGDATDAMASYDRALELKPESSDAHFGRSLIHLLRGEFGQGWKAYSFRWTSTHFDTKWREYSQPVWNGERIESGSLLIWKEQGVGDEIMFAGMVPELVRRGVPCVLECDRRLQPLFARSFPEVRVVAEQPAEEEIAAHLPIGSLPELFRGDQASFSRTRSPYLFADAIVRDGFRARYGEGRIRIGLAWRTKNRTTGRRRSIDLSLLAGTLHGVGAGAGTQWISLQYGGHEAIEAEAKSAGLELTVDRSVDQFEDMDLFAAQVSSLDLVISIDNSTAHLAGALGVPPWVLLPSVPDWRWMEQSEESPWYPTARLFRQRRPGDWESVLRGLREALAGKEFLRATGPRTKLMSKEEWPSG